MAGSGDNLLFGGVGSDTVYAGLGRDSAIGDVGEMRFDSDGTPLTTVTYDYIEGAAGGDDTLWLSVVARSQITALAAGERYVDERFDPYFILSDGRGNAISALQINRSGDINAASGGAGGDSITSGVGADWLIGDYGQIVYGNGNIVRFSSKEIATRDGDGALVGGFDFIDGGDGANFLVGGAGDDVLVGGLGDDRLFGDHIDFYWSNSGRPLRVVTSDSANSDGGDDLLIAGAGDNLLIGGVGADSLLAGLGNDYALGDVGEVHWSVLGAVSAMVSDHYVESRAGGDDLLMLALSEPPQDTAIAGVTLTEFGEYFSAAGRDRNIAIAGAGADTLFTAAGDDVVVGDFARLNFRYDGALLSLQSRDVAARSRAGELAGGDDLLYVGDGDNVAIGGAGSDQLYAGVGSDLLAGDHVHAEYTVARGHIRTLVSTDSDDSDGGDDLLVAGSGDNIVVAGVGSDTVMAGLAQDIIVGDLADLRWSGIGTLSSVQTQPYASHVAGSDDLIYASVVSDSAAAGEWLVPEQYAALFAGNDRATDNNLLVGGAGGDQLFAGAGDDIVVGDFAALQWDLRRGLYHLQSLDSDVRSQADDYIDAGHGNNLLLGGGGSDTMLAGSGDDIAAGDAAVYRVDDDGRQQLSSLDNTLTLASADTLLLGSGDNRVIAGEGRDRVIVGLGSDSVIGDAGTISWHRESGNLQLLSHFDSAALGDSDTLSLSQSGAQPSALEGVDVDHWQQRYVAAAAPDNNVAVAGQGRDAIVAGSGNDLLVGDYAEIRWSENAQLSSVQSRDLNIAEALLPGSSDDQITALGGDNIIVGGSGDDRVESGEGSDLVAGDHLTIGFDGTAVAISVTTIDSRYSDGGHDWLSVGEGNNLVAGGVGRDKIVAGGGDDIIAGDQLQLLRDALGRPVSLVSTERAALTATQRSDDDIDAGHGDNAVVGGPGADLLSSGDGDDTLLGDSGYIEWLAGQRSAVVSLPPVVAAHSDDQLSSGAGRDQLIGGAGSDTVVNGSGESVLLGDHGEIRSDHSGRFWRVDDYRDSSGAGDILNGGSDRDVIFGSDGDDVISAGGGDDIVIGDYGIVEQSALRLSIEADEIGRGGVDQLRSGSGHDIVVGGHRGDQLGGELGSDLLFGDYQQLLLARDDGAGERLLWVRDAYIGQDLIRAVQAPLLGEPRPTAVGAAAALQQAIRQQPPAQRVTELESSIAVPADAAINLLKPQGIRLQRSVTDLIEAAINDDKRQAAALVAPLAPALAQQSGSELASSSIASAVAGSAIAKRGWHSRRLALQALAGRLRD